MNYLIVSLQFCVCVCVSFLSQSNNTENYNTMRVLEVSLNAYLKKENEVPNEKHEIK